MKVKHFRIVGKLWKYFHIDILEILINRLLINLIYDFIIIKTCYLLENSKITYDSYEKMVIYTVFNVFYYKLQNIF